MRKPISAAPTPINLLRTVNNSSTSVVLQWKAGFHGIELSSLSRIDPPESSGNGALDKVCSGLRNFIHEWRAASRCAQTFTLDLWDHGLKDETTKFPFNSTLRYRHDDWMGHLPDGQHIGYFPVGHTTVVNVSGLLPARLYSAAIRSNNQLAKSVQSKRIYFFTKTFIPTVPKGVVVHYLNRFIRIPPGNPACCVELQKSMDGGITWMFITRPGPSREVITVTGLHTSSPVATVHFRDPLSCTALSWTRPTELPISLDGKYRLRYCAIGQPNLCTELVYPEQGMFFHSPSKDLGDALH
ncbi:unnamed protein product [Dicrocoelium dendriticum]|nr:unnamed protein product [Dicrocoelium dendriticum]